MSDEEVDRAFLIRQRARNIKRIRQARLLCEAVVLSSLERMFLSHCPPVPFYQQIEEQAEMSNQQFEVADERGRALPPRWAFWESKEWPDPTLLKLSETHDECLNDCPFPVVVSEYCGLRAQAIGAGEIHAHYMTRNGEPRCDILATTAEAERITDTYTCFRHAPGMEVKDIPLNEKCSVCGWGQPKETV